MKKLSLRINSWILGLLLMLSLGIGLFALPNSVGNLYAEGAAGPTPNPDGTYNEIPWDYTAENIPYTLYVSSKKEGVDYFTKYDYEGEYIMLTSDASDSTLYNSSIYLHFNDSSNNSTDTKVPAAGLTVNAWLGDRQINVNKISTVPTNGYVRFAISFRDTTVMTYADTLEPVAPEDRAGLYQFEFIYRYTTMDGVTSDEQSRITMSFTVINKVDYLSGESAYTISGASKAEDVDYRGETRESYVYNYKYDASGNITYPTVSYEAHKFALNYQHTIGTSIYNHSYTSFIPNYLSSEINSDTFLSDVEKENALLVETGRDAEAAYFYKIYKTKPTGSVKIAKVGTSTINNYPTYKYEAFKVLLVGGVVPEITAENLISLSVKPYYASIPLTELGEYMFSVDILIEQNLGSTATYDVAYIPELENSEVKYLTNFGYELTYKDQVADTYKLLRNEYTHADIYSATTTETSAHVPTELPVTDQAPLKFNYYSTSFDKAKSFYKNYSSKDDFLAAITELTAMSYDELIIDNKLDTTFYETSKFDMAGYYIIKVCYSIKTSYNQTFYGAQLFAFEINNKAPALVVEYDIDGTQNYAPLNTQYTNKNVRFKIQKSLYSFNAPVTIKYTRYAAFNDVATTTNTYVATDLEDGYYSYTMATSDYSIPNSLNGRYIIVVTYSPSKLNQYYQYIVDTSDIQEITFTKVSLEEEGYYIATKDTIAQTKTQAGDYDISIATPSYTINNMGNETFVPAMFTLSWAEKPWARYVANGITTKVSAYQLLIKSSGAPISYYESYDKTLTNGYITDTAAPLNYQNSYNRIKNQLALNSNEYQTADGIYYYYVEDLAGNSFERIILLDNSAPTFMQESLTDDGEGHVEYVNSYDILANPANFVRTNTKLTFGKNKGIVYNYLETTENKIFNAKLANTSLFKQFEGSKYFINIPIKVVEYNKNIEGVYRPGAIENPDDFAVVELKTSGVGIFDGEGQYYFTSYAANGTKIALSIEMNFDGAMGQFYMSGDRYGNSEEHYIANYNGSNLHKLLFKFKQGEEQTYVAEITYSYFKFDYFAETDNYPFATVAEKTENLRIPEADEVDANGFYTTDFINLDNGKTAPGKYVLTRYYYGGGYQKVGNSYVASTHGKYDSNGVEIDFGQDSYSRSYTIYVDHNGIISTTEQSGVREVGDNISITIGKGTPNEYTFKNFYRNVSAGNPILTTNKLPIQINIPVSKYFIDKGSENLNKLSRLNFAALDIVITYKDTTVAFSPTVTYRITESLATGYFKIPTFEAEGTYTITISDRTGYNYGSTMNINPMVYNCTFIVRHTYPNGDVYLNGEELEPSELDDKMFATNADKEQSVTFVWQDAQDPYTASVVEFNISALGIDAVETLILTDYNMQDIITGTYVMDLTAFTYIKSFNVECLSEDVFEHKIYYQYRYTVELNIDEEFDYTITIRYAPSTETNHGYGQYVSTSYRVKIDRTKPNNNIDYLLEQDAYLIANGYYNGLEHLKENFKEENAVYSSSTPTIYDYAFARLSTDYKLIYDGEDTVSYFYFRKYSKYVDDNQSLTPDHKDYNNLSNFSNFPRFNITTSNSNYMRAQYEEGKALAAIIKEVSGIDQNNLVGSFYEIIERDLAGNYRAFTVYFKDDITYQVLNIEAVRTESGAEVKINTSEQETTTTFDLTIKTIASVVGWGKLTVSNVTDPSKMPRSYNITPYLDFATIYNITNEISNYMISTKNCKIAFELKNPTGLSTKYFNIVKSNTKLPIPDIIETSDNKYIMMFPQKTPTSVIYLTSLTVKFGNQLIIDVSGNNIPSQSGELIAGLYLVTYVDNTGERYTYQLHLGIDYVSSEQQFTFATNSSLVDTDGVIYTGGNVFITFQSQAHTILIKNITTDPNALDVEVDAAKYNIANPILVDFGGISYIKLNNDIYLRTVDPSVPDNGFRVILITEPTINDSISSEIIGGTKTYEVNYKYSNYKDNGAESSSINTYKIVIYNKLAGINLSDSNNNPISGSTTSGSMALTSSSVKINWEGLSDAPLSNLYNAVVILNSLTESGNIISSIELTNNRIISTPGYYAVTLCNTAFGNFRNVYFAIQDGEIPFYTVVDTVTGAALTASPITLDIVNNMDVTTSDSIKTRITKHIEYMLGAGTDEAKALINKLTAAPTNVEQYFSLNDCDLRLDASSELYFFEIYFKNGSYIADLSSGIGKQDFLTTFYLIYGDNNPIYSNLIAVTKVPKSSTNIVADKLYYVYKTTMDVSNKLTGISKTIKNNELDSNGVRIYWSSVSNDNIAWYNRGNLVYLNYTFNNVTSVRNFGSLGQSLTIPSNSDLSTITISGSGKHQLTFMDLAGNVSFFKTASSGYSQPYYQVTVLDKVIFTVNNATPLDYAVYNSDITLSIDTSYSNDYNINSLVVTVSRNGSYYENYITNDDGSSFTFSESGRYIVTLNASYQDTSSLNTAYYNFTIIDKTSARLAYEFNEMLGYEITKIYKNNIDITERVKTSYMQAEGLAIDPADYTLRELFISPSKFGNGDYIVHVSVKYNALLAAKEFVFGFKISDVVPVIMSDPAYGETTKGTITLSFNAAYIYQQIGKSSLKVFTFNSDTNRFNEVDRYEINEESLKLEGIQTFKISETNSYYFQLVTDSGNIITSFRINRAEPLNALSIIIIVIASITVVVLIILFIKMRTKMKVR